MTEQPEIVFENITAKEQRWLARAVKDETFGGALLLIAALAAIVVANSGLGDLYWQVLHTKVGIGALSLEMTVAHWVSDGLLAIFFLVAGLELKHEFVHGSLSKPSQALVPIVAAIAGMTFPAIIFVSLLAGDSEALAGWAIPIATDIAFALAVLAVAGRSLPNELRAFLLTVAVVDDLGAISIIAVFYSDTINQQMLLLTVGLLAVYALLQTLNITNWYLLVPLGLVIWWTTYQSGIHATVAGVMIALLTRNKLKVNESLSPAERAEIKIRPISVAIVVPLFAFVAAGVDLRSIGFSQTVSSNMAIGIILALAIGKPVGIFGATYLVTKLTRASLNPTLRWSDVFAIGLLAGIGFTVSLLITELSFGSADALLAEAKVGVLAASALSALLAVIMLQVRARRTITS